MSNKKETAKKIIIEENFESFFDDGYEERYRNDIFRCPCCNRELGRGISDNSEDFNSLDIHYCPGCGQKVIFDNGNK